MRLSSSRSSSIFLNHIRLFFVLFLSTLSLSVESLYGDEVGTLVVRKTKSLSSQIKKPGGRYVIKHDFDLNGGELRVPDACTLVFKGGRIINGIVTGQNTVVEAAKKTIFIDVHIKGCFMNDKVYSQWFDLKEGDHDNRPTFDALMAMADNGSYCDVFIQKGNYFTSVGAHAEGISIPSRTYVHNEACIMALPTDLAKYDIISLSNVSEVTFDGGQIIGDVGRHRGDAGEWGYGIGLTGARDCVIKNVHVSRCWGDGINIQALYSDYENNTIEGHCYDIKIEHVVCDDNRRQGMSIEGAIGVYVSDSQFLNTGVTESTAPSAGIDIEPWYATEIVSNVVISRCEFRNNKGGNLIAPFTRDQWNGGKCRHFMISDNVFDDCILRFNRCRDLIIRNNVIGESDGRLEFNQYQGVSILSNTINGSVAVYSEGDSYDGNMSDNQIRGKKRLSLALDTVSDNKIEGVILFQESRKCVLTGNIIDSTGIPDSEHSLVCDNASLTVYSNHFKLDKPMIFRFKSNCKIHDNVFEQTGVVTPACLIMQTARNTGLKYDAEIHDNEMKGNGRFWVNYSANGKYSVSHD